MIPALLSCIFVGYLYVSLNAEAANPQSDTSGEHKDRLDRLKAIDERIQRLLDKTTK